MKAYGGVKTSRSTRFTLGESGSSTHCIWSWMMGPGLVWTFWRREILLALATNEQMMFCNQCSFKFSERTKTLN